MLARIEKFHGIRKLRLKRLQSQIIWKCEERSSRNIWRWTRYVWFCASEWKSMYPCKDLDDVNEFDLREYQVKVKTEKEQIKRRNSCVQERIKNLRQKFSIYSKLSYFNPGWNFSYNCNFFPLFTELKFQPGMKISMQSVPKTIW